LVLEANLCNCRTLQLKLPAKFYHGQKYPKPTENRISWWRFIAETDFGKSLPGKQETALGQL
jgi:hypothetical protein